MNSSLLIGRDNQGHNHPCKIDTHGHLHTVLTESEKTLTNGDFYISSVQVSGYSVPAYTTYDTDAVDTSNIKHIAFYGQSTNTMDAVDIYVSPDNVNWYKFNYNLYPDWSTGAYFQEVSNFVMPYMRLRINNQQQQAETYTISYTTMAF